MVFSLIIACGGGRATLSPPANNAADASGTSMDAGAGDAAMASMDATAADLPAAPTAVTWSPCGPLLTDRAPRPPHALAVSANGRLLALLDTFLSTGPSDDPQQSVVLWDLITGKMISRIGDPHFDWGSYALDVDLSPAGDLLAVTGDGSEVVRTADGVTVWSMPPLPDVPADQPMGRTFAFSPDGRRLAVGGVEGAHVVQSDTGILVADLPKGLFVVGLAFSPDGLSLGSSVPELVKVNDWSEAWNSPAYAANVNQQGELVDNWSTFSPSGKELLFQRAEYRPNSGTPGRATWKTSTGIIDVATQRLVRPLTVSLGRRPTYAPDGRHIVAAATVIDLATGSTQTLDGTIEVSVFLPDGRIAAARPDGTVELHCPR